MAKVTKKIAKKSAKVARKARGEGGTFDKAATDWNAKQVAQARAKHNKVKVGGKEYPSLYKAFAALDLPLWQHQAFRKALKIKRRLGFAFKGRTYQFAVV